jgi:glyoxylase-like metal-dependent hydrolase (beta-lactamase superfamily II)
MGGAPNDYQKALRNNAEKLLTLPDDTLICPGHGPLTTVKNEREHNPFFAR